MSELQRRTFAANVGRRASIREMHAALREEFARALLARKFGEVASALILESFGKVTKGRHEGDQRGHLHWTKCEAGGWDGKRVVRPGSQNYRVTFNGAPDIASIVERGGYRGSEEAYLTYVEQQILRLLPRARVRSITQAKESTE